MGGKDKKFSKKIGVGSSYTRSTAVQDLGQECVLCWAGLELLQDVETGDRREISTENCPAWN